MRIEITPEELADLVNKLQHRPGDDVETWVSILDAALEHPIVPLSQKLCE